MYLLILTILFILTASSYFLQEKYSSMLGLNYGENLNSMIYGLTLALIFILIKSIMPLKEGFFFEVDDNNIQRCSGLYQGQPTTFQYDAVGYGSCKPQRSEPLGYIDPNNESVRYGSGVYTGSSNFV